MICIDLEAGLVTVDHGGDLRSLPLSSPEGFAIVSQAWLRAGWDIKYVYSFTWLGRPVIQLPEDLIRIQEVIYSTKPDVLIETGVAHGGSLIFYAGLFRAMGQGRVIGVDIEIRPRNRVAIEAHFLSPLIQLVEGDSVSPQTMDRLRREIQPSEKVFVALDSNHSKDHVLAELEAYSPLVSPGSYIVVMDGIMGDLADAPRGDPDWAWNNPRSAVDEFIARHPDFVSEEPPFLFNEGNVEERITYWPAGYLRRVD